MLITEKLLLRDSVAVPHLNRTRRARPTIASFEDAENHHSGFGTENDHYVVLCSSAFGGGGRKGFVFSFSQQNHAELGSNSHTPEQRHGYCCKWTPRLERDRL